MQDVETGGSESLEPGQAADVRRTRGPDKRPRRPRGTQYPWRASVSLTQEDGERVEAAANRLNTSIPEAMRQAVKSGLPLVMDKARKRKARKGGRA